MIIPSILLPKNKRLIYIDKNRNQKKIPRVVYKLLLESFATLKRMMFPNDFKMPEIMFLPKTIETLTRMLVTTHLIL